jgi:hypothetical protein
VAGYGGWSIKAAERHGEVVVSIGTGGDDFHAPARALYESLGFTPFPTVNYTRAL